ncbi:MAG TPA: hypothetical protein VK876_11720, partial [Rubrivivax sp.]|nr:hypothetical protein [Rubrivivax sp.]
MTVSPPVCKAPAKPVGNPQLLARVQDLIELCTPDQVFWCDGSQAEYDELCEQMVQAGTF